MPPSQPRPTIDIPVIERYPEFQPRRPPIADIINYMLTRLLSDSARALYADYGRYAGCWILQNSPHEIPAQADVVAQVPEKGIFRMILARFGHEFLSGQVYGGYGELFLRQRDEVRVAAFYLGNDSFRGFWFRASIDRSNPLTV